MYCILHGQLWVSDYSEGGVMHGINKGITMFIALCCLLSSVVGWVVIESLIWVFNNLQWVG